MAVNLHVPSNDQLSAVAGCQIGVTQAGIRKAQRKDLTLFSFAPGTVVAGVLTKNRFCAAPVQVCKEHLATSAHIRGLIINTGCANAGTGESGLVHARQMAHGAAHALGVDAHAVLPFSTGVILEPLPIDRVLAGIQGAQAALGEAHWLDAAHGIMTTDTLPKAASRTVMIGGQRVVISGISKGAGMIRPNMATMLGFIATNAKVAPAALQAMTKIAADASFNRITIDGDTSTNDSFIIAATGQTALTEITDVQSESGRALLAALTDVARELAQKIVRDGEGATKFITLVIEQAANTDEALKVGYAIAHSPLVKTAFFASDPNLGRILAAVGYAGIEDLDQTKINMWIEQFKVVSNGGRDPNYTEQDGQTAMKQSEITVRVALGRGHASETVYTCDLSHEYVSINADYRS